MHALEFCLDVAAGLVPRANDPVKECLPDSLILSDIWQHQTTTTRRECHQLHSLASFFSCGASWCRHKLTHTHTRTSEEAFAHTHTHITRTYMHTHTHTIFAHTNLSARTHTQYVRNCTLDFWTCRCIPILFTPMYLHVTGSVLFVHKGNFNSTSKGCQCGDSLPLTMVSVVVGTVVMLPNVPAACHEQMRCRTLRRMLFLLSHELIEGLLKDC